LEEGCLDAVALELASSSGLGHCVAVPPSLVELRSLLRSLKQHETQPALRWCQTHRSKLKKLNSPLEPLLRLQAFATRVACGDIAGAVAYSREHFPGFATEHPQLVRQAMGSLALPPSARRATHAAMAPWDTLCEHLRSAHRVLTATTPSPPLLLTLAAGLAVLRTPDCQSPPTIPVVATHVAGAPGPATERPSEEEEGEEEGMEMEMEMEMEEVAEGEALQATNAEAEAAAAEASAAAAGMVGLSAGGAAPLRWGPSDAGRGGDDRPQAAAAAAAAAARTAVGGGCKAALCGGGGGGGGGGGCGGRVATDCPVCTLPYARLAARLPSVQRSQSRIVCRLSGQHTDADNLPMVLPDGSVFSQKALLELAGPDGSFAHPLTGERLHLEQLRKAFFL
jgi:hypothetical protein